MNAVRLAFLALAAACFLPATALAEVNADAFDEADPEAYEAPSPYAPHITPAHQLIITERFSAAPLDFPWEQISTDRVANRRGRMDFEVIYDIDFATVGELLRENYSNAEDFVHLRPGALRHTQVTLLRIAGMELGEERGRITLGHPDMEPVFIVELEADGPRTRVVINNSATARQFSGFVPARAGFRPMGAATIPFRWN